MIFVLTYTSGFFMFILFMSTFEHNVKVRECLKAKQDL